MDVMSLSNSHRLIDLFLRRGRAETAERMLSEIPTTTGAPTSQQYTRIYESVTNTYLSNGDPNKAIEYFWKYIEKTNPTVSNTRYVASLTYSTYSRQPDVSNQFPITYIVLYSDTIGFSTKVFQ